MTVSDKLPGPLNYNEGALRKSIVVPGRTVVYGFTVTNTNAAAQFVLCFDASALPAEGAVPLFSKSIPAHDAVGFDWAPTGRQFQTGLVLCNSSTDATKTIGAADCFFDVQFDVYAEQNAPGTGE